MQSKVNGINGNGNWHCMDVSRQRVIAGFPPRCKRDLRPTGMLRIVDWQLTTFRDNLSVPYSRAKQSILFFLDCLTPEIESDRLSRNVGN
jgi:hypothetical protein